MYLAPELLFAPLIAAHIRGARAREVSLEVAAALKTATALFQQVCVRGSGFEMGGG